MARGWESKDVESQQDALDRDRPSGPRLTPAEAAAARERETLELTRKRLLLQIAETGNERYRELLRKSLAEVEARIERL